MGAYLILYFVSLVLALVFFHISKKKDKKKYDNLAIFFMLLMVFFLVFALYTDDPIEELLTTIPVFWQFVLTSLGGAFTIWKVYLNPLKEKVYDIDKDVATIKVTISRVENELKNSFGRLESKIENINTANLAESEECV